MTDLARLRELEKAARGRHYHFQARIEFREAMERAAPALLTAAEECERMRSENQIRAQEYAALLGLWKETQERLEKAERALFALFSLCGSLQFEPDAGQPHPVKDGIYDKIMAQARNHLAQYDSHAEQKETT